MAKNYLESRIKGILSEMNTLFYTWQQRNEMAELLDDENTSMQNDEYVDALEDDFIYNAKMVFRLICSYLESNNQIEFLKDFKNCILPILDEKQKIFNQNVDGMSGELYSDLLFKINSFLSAYEFFGENSVEYLLRNSGIHFLKNILLNTASILNDLNIIPKSEPDVYKNVKHVCNAVFPNAAHPSSPFISTAQEYKPDILIPSLHVAIEYKYASEVATLKKTIDQVLADVVGYSNHPIYKLFFAVFYVTNDFWGLPRFNQIWEEKKFPNNWIGIYVVGNGTVKSPRRK